MIQEIIKRLSQNSFLLKGWSIFLTSALVAFLAREGKPAGLLLVCIPILILWGLDGYFLRQESLFRALYDHVRTLSDEDIDFSMDTKTVRVASWFSVTTSKTLRTFHGAIFVVIVLLSVIYFFTNKNCLFFLP